MRPYGQIILFNNLHFDIFSIGQRFFTEQPYTHTAFIVPPALGVEWYYGAEQLAVIRPISYFENDTKKLYQMYLPKVWTDEQILNALRKLYTKFGAEKYGYWQILWFMFRWLMSKWPFKKDVRKWHNFFPNHVICSELGWWYLWFLYEEQPDLTELKDELNQWSSDTIHSGDIHTIINNLPHLFRMTEERWEGKRAA